MQVQEAQRVPNKMYAKRPTARHIISKRPKVKDKERILKVARGPGWCGLPDCRGEGKMCEQVGWKVQYLSLIHI